jgi:hypothetical protein
MKTMVVGNCASLLDKPRGKLIDSYDCIVRFNNFRLVPEYTGERTTVWATSFFHNPKKPHQIVQPLEGRVREPLSEIKVVYPFSIRKKPPAAMAGIKKYNAEVVPEEIIAKLESYVKKPSTGLAYLWWYYKINGHLPDVLGFSFFENPGHYYSKIHIHTTHDGRQERNIFRLMQRKSIKID